jgi:hypothetical protein
MLYVFDSKRCGDPIDPVRSRLGRHTLSQLVASYTLSNASSGRYAICANLSKPRTPVSFTSSTVNDRCSETTSARQAQPPPISPPRNAAEAGGAWARGRGG